MSTLLERIAAAVGCYEGADEETVVARVKVYVQLLDLEATLRKDTVLRCESAVLMHQDSEKRRKELVEENMALMADLSTARTTIAEQRAAVEQFHRDHQGHNMCWVNPLRLFAAFGLEPLPLNLPPLDERMHGCAKFWETLDAHPERWPDFLPKEKK